MRSMIARILKKILPFKLYKLIANGFIIMPKYYKGIIDEAEVFFNYSLETHPKKDLMLMRKYGHILDKGLHRQDASPGHSKQVYEELKDKVECIKNSEYRDDPTFQWAQKKLEKYEALQQCPEKFVPLAGNVVEPEVTFQQISDLIKSRRSNRNFSQRKVDNETIKKLIGLTSWAANSCNKQPIEIYYTNDEQKAKECLKCCKGGTGFSDSIPVFMAFTANCRAYVWPSEMFLPTLDVSLGAQNLFLAAHTLGISGTILSWAQHDKDEEKKLRELLRIPNDCVIVFCAVLGYAETQFTTPERKL